VEVGGNAAFPADDEQMVLPVKVVLTNTPSIGAAPGAVVRVFQDGNIAGVLGTEGLGVTNLTVPVLVGAGTVAAHP
jgi:RND superfamily putative drug exporter